jgi:A/G-specific adenine glycosylase
MKSKMGLMLKAATTHHPARSIVLLGWYDQHRRTLPWRALPGQLPDPYQVWLSEIMLQQTTVATVKGYFARFLALWPTVADLAAAPVEDVMQAWAGLGYYARARNLHACARMVAAEHGGRFPASEQALRALPGIGAYTAAAIAAIAFGQRAVVVDGNVERVVTRLFAVETPMPAAKPAIYALTDTLTPAERAGDFAQAIMDLGSSICTPRRPLCALCPLMEGCEARKAGTQEQFPVKQPKEQKPTRRGAAFVALRADGAVLVRPRPPTGLLGGMLEVPGTEWAVVPHLPATADGAPFGAAWQRAAQAATHVFTHFRLELSVFVAHVPLDIKTPPGCQWLTHDRLDSAALPTTMKKVIAAALLDQAA